MSSLNDRLLLPTVFTIGFIVGGVVVRFIKPNNNDKELQRRILTDDIRNDRKKEIDDDDITVVGYRNYKKHLPKFSFSSFSCHSSSSSSSSISPLYSPFSFLSNNFISPDSPNSLTSINELLNQLHIYQKNLYKKQQTFYSDAIEFDHQYTSLLTETNTFKAYSCLQVSKSKERLESLKQKIKSFSKRTTPENINISEINNNMKMQIAEAKWFEIFNEIYKGKLEEFIKSLSEMKRNFDVYEQRTLKEIEDLKRKIEELKCDILVYEDEEIIKEIREEKFGELTSLLFENN